MKKPSAKHIRTDTDADGIRHIVFEYRGKEYTITDEDDELMVDKHLRAQELIDARLERQHRAERREEAEEHRVLYDVDEIFRKLGWA